jgi:RNA polymerase sigma factor (sigma-70 family)
MSPRISIRLLASQTDQRLLALACEGHERAFEALVHRYRRPLLRYARRSMRLSESRAEDVLQQSFMQAWIALSHGAQVRDGRAWLYRIVHNAAVNAIRGPEAPGELTQAVEDRAGLARVSNIERTIAMRDALGEVAALPAMQQQAIFLTAVDGQSHEQVAGTLGISPDALRGLLYRARTAMRSAAAALTPPPLVAWACSAGSSPTSERLIELSAGGGGAGIAGLIAKGAVVAATAGAVATGAGVLGAGHDHASGSGARPAAVHVSAARSGGSPSLASSYGAAMSAAGRRPFAGRPFDVHRGGRRHGRSALQPRHRAAGAGGDRRGEGAGGSRLDGRPGDGDHGLASGSSGRDGSGDLRGGDGGSGSGSTSGSGTSAGGSATSGGSTGSTSGPGSGTLGGGSRGDGSSGGGGSSGSSSGDGLTGGGATTTSLSSADASTSIAGAAAPETTRSSSDG